MLSAPHIALLLNCGCVLGSSAFSWSNICTGAATTSRNKALFQNDDCCCDGGGESTHSRSLTPTGELSRRKLVKETLTISSVTTTTAYMMPLLTLLSSTDIAMAAGCDPKEPSCGFDGKVTDGESSRTIQLIPRVTNKITHVVQLVINIGERREEVGFLRFGLVCFWLFL